MPDRPLIAKWFIVRAAFPFVGAALVLALATCQHGGEAPFKKTCLPTHMIRLSDSLAFTYDANGRPTTLQYWSGDVMRQQYVMAYGGHVIKCTRWQDNVEKESFSFIYDILGNPITRLRLVNGVATGDSVLYSHDEAGRLVQMEFRSNGVFQRRTRYEYDGDNNVRKIFKQTGDKRERIVFRTSFVRPEEKIFWVFARTRDRGDLSPRSRTQCEQRDPAQHLTTQHPKTSTLCPTSLIIILGIRRIR